MVEVKDESDLCFFKRPRETMNLLFEVLAVANGTPYTLASLRSVGSGIFVFTVLLLGKVELLKKLC